MTTDLTTTNYQLRRRQIAASEARCAVFRRSYDAEISDVWDACTNPERLSRWYAPVEGQLVVGGSFTQGDFGPGSVVRCEAPRHLSVALGNAKPATDEINLTLHANADGTTTLEFEHATTLDTHTIGGQIFDAIYCMGGGYGPRFVTLGEHLSGTLPTDVDPATLHLRAEYQSAIEDSVAALDVLLKADQFSDVPPSW